MNNYPLKSVLNFFLFSSMVVFHTVCVSAQTSRQIEVKVLDEQDQPLADAKVLVRNAVTRWLGDELSFSDKPPVLPHALGTTDASGVANIEVGQLLSDVVDGPMSVTVWKMGYGPQSTSVQQKVELKCWPTRKRTMQIVDWQDKPVSGVRVEQVTAMEGAPEETKIRWWKEEAVVTDEFGLATLETHASGQLNIAMTETDGTIHRAAVNNINRLAGRLPDLRDLSVIRLSPHGSIEGQLPAEFAKDYGVRIDRDYRSSGFRSIGNQTGFSAVPIIDPDGHFRFESVAEGWYRLVVYRRTPLEPSSGNLPTKQPAPLVRVEVAAGKTAKVKLETVPLAKVSGRVVSANDDGDLSELRLLISRASSDEVDNRNPQRHAVDRALCKADGTFVCPLPVGRYQLMAMSNKWSAPSPIEFEVGAGAVTTATDDLRVTPLKKAKVTWQREQRWANSLLDVMDRRLVFRSKDRQLGDCTLTADGFGIAYLIPNEEVTVITRDSIIPNSQATRAFVDKDPSENFDLELIKTPQGLATNIAMRGRVVDIDGKAMANVPVTIALTFEGVSGTAGRSSMQTGSQLLDVVLSERDGSFYIPPRQLLSRMTIPGRVATDEAKFKFTISTQANPQPIETQKVFTLKPDAWDALEIEFPDLVIDRPLGGNRLTGKVMDAEGKPSAGELLRLADKRHLVRALSDREGSFAVEDLAGPTWLMRESDWSVHPINDYSQPINFDSAKAAAPVAAGSGWQRLDRADRIKLAKELVQAVPAPQAALGFLPGRGAAAASDDFYLEPQKAFDQLLLMKGANADLLRYQFVEFWTDLSDEKIQQLAEAMTQNYSRVQLLMMLADRHPTVTAYEKIMGAIEYPESAERRNPQAMQIFDTVANVGVKLHLYGALEPHRAKIRQFLEQYAIEAAKTPPPNPGNAANPLNARMWIADESPALSVCRALVDPEQFAANVLEEVTASYGELSNEERMSQMKNVATFLQLFPAEFSRIPADRLSFPEAAMQNLGMQAPMQAIEAVRQGKLGPELLRLVATSALASGHEGAAEVFRESNKLLLQSDASRTRVSASMFNARSRQPDLLWYEVAKTTSPQLGRMAAWHLAYDYLSGKLEDSTVTILPMRERYHVQMLSWAYCLIDDYPELAEHIAQRAIPRLLANTEQEFGQTFGRSSDFSFVAWFDPHGACDLVIKLKKRLDDEQKNQPAGQRDARLYSKQNELALLRITCLRGLLLDGL